MERARQRLLESLEEDATPEPRAPAVPAAYAERAMNSVMALHQDLVAEKERVLDLTRRLLEARQARSELEAYVRLLEAEVARLGGPDLRDDRRGDAEDLRRLLDRVLGARRAAGEGASAEAAATDGTPSEAVGAPSAARSEAPGRVPRPPRPSRRYRTKVAPPAPSPAEAADGAAAPARPPRARDEGWRQW